MLTYERAHERLMHDRDTGELFWKVSHWKRVKAGNVAGDKYRNGYRRVCVDSKEYLAHRVVWMMAYGEWPTNEIDHINGDRADNRLCNLRLATSTQNKQNTGRRSDNKSGRVGVSWQKNLGKWQAAITVNRKQRHLGFYPDIESAAMAYAKAKAELHKFQPVSRL